MEDNNKNFNNEKNTNPQSKAQTQDVNTSASPEQKPDFFQLTKQQLSVNVEKYDKALKPSMSLFNMQTYNPQKTAPQPAVMPKRLNSTDSAMLEEKAYIALDDPELRLEKRIENYENSIKTLNEKLEVAETINDEKSRQELLSQKKLMEKNLENLQLQYKEQNFDTKLTTVIARAMRLPREIRVSLQKAIINFVRHSEFIRKYTPIVRALTIRDTLGRLDKINKSVDELVKMKVPLGEQDAKYEALVTHLQRAGALHSQILRELKG